MDPFSGGRITRELRDEARTLVVKGVNPRAHRKQKRAAVKLAGENDFKLVFDRWHAHRSLSLKKGRQTALSQIERVFANDVLPKLGHRSISDIKRQDLLDVLGAIERREACSVAKKVRFWFNQMFRYALVKVEGLESIRLPTSMWSPNRRRRCGTSHSCDWARCPSACGCCVLIPEGCKRSLACGCCF